jgi:hypothetical protein
LKGFIKNKLWNCNWDFSLRKSFFGWGRVMVGFSLCESRFSGLLIALLSTRGSLFDSYGLILELDGARTIVALGASHCLRHPHVRMFRAPALNPFGADAKK